jgi:hypothetical protein
MRYCRIILDGISGRTWKEAVVAYFNILRTCHIRCRGVKFELSARVSSLLHLDYIGLFHCARCVSFRCLHVTGCHYTHTVY